MVETAFGRYRLVELLGRGGMGEVWRAFDTETQRVVAVKVLPPNLASDPIFEERFRREALAAAGLTDPHVVPIHNFGEIEGRLYVDMRLINGKDLKAVIADGVLQPERTVAIIEQIASALHDAHRIGLVHRDVKPSNILVTENDFAYLIDFGIARAMGDTRMTSTGNVIGTMAYLAPERVTTGQIDPRADIYALACVLHECLTGSQPYPGDSLERQIGGHLGLPPPRPSALCNGLPAEFDTVIATGMAKNPDERYSTVTELAAAARAAITQSATALAPVRSADQLDTLMARVPGDVAPTAPTQQRPTGDYLRQSDSKPNRRRRRVILASIGAAIAVVGIVLGIALANTGRSGNSTHRPVGPTSSALPNSGPFTGTYAADFGPKLALSGKEIQGTPPSQETWKLRSVCGAKGCVATAVRTAGSYGHATRLVFDDAAGRWVAIALGTAKCHDRDVESWDFVWLRPRPDGSMAGEWITDSLQCYSKRNVTFRRTGDADVAALADPANESARVVSPALALHGVYHSVTTYTGIARPPKPREEDFRVETVCLRAGDRCISRFVVAGADQSLLFVFANGAWTRNQEFDAACSTGGTSHVEMSGVFPLPNPPQDPIMQLFGHGFKNNSGNTSCKSSNYDEVFSRIGD